MNTVHGRSVPARASAFEKVSSGWIAFTRRQRPGIRTRVMGSLAEMPGGKTLAGAWSSLGAAAQTCASYRKANDEWQRAFATVLQDRCPALGRQDGEALVKSMVGAMDVVNESTLLAIVQRASQENLRRAAADASAAAVERLPGFEQLDEDSQAALRRLLEQQVRELLEHSGGASRGEDVIDGSRRAANEALGTLDLEACNLLAGTQLQERAPIAAKAFANLRTWAAVQVLDGSSPRTSLGEAWCAFIKREAEFAADRRRRPVRNWDKPFETHASAASDARGRRHHGREAHARAAALPMHHRDRITKGNDGDARVRAELAPARKASRP
ncbi:hypothetical protein WG922_13100 [Ramlibacter sp. AN1015]|uniref:hypothetical protein n=1 Tax=Ramlibacter sp. AN1015 TaxID=3133428 RepID=UPI0030BF2F87